MSLSGGRSVLVYRGFASAASDGMSQVVGIGEIGGQISRQIAAAQDAVFNQYGRDPQLSGPKSGGVVQVTIPAGIWDDLVAKFHLSERSYYGFSRRLVGCTEIRVNSPEAGEIINRQPRRILPPDSRYDFRSQ